MLIKHALSYRCNYTKHMLRVVPLYGSIRGSTPSPLYRVSLLFGKSLKMFWHKLVSVFLKPVYVYELLRRIHNPDWQSLELASDSTAPTIKPSRVSCRVRGEGNVHGLSYLPHPKIFFLYSFQYAFIASLPDLSFALQNAVISFFTSADARFKAKTRTSATFCKMSCGKFSFKCFTLHRNACLKFFLSCSALKTGCAGN